MQLNSNFAERVSVHSADIPWKTSPMPGVERRMLDRLGDEVARATTIVKYAPNSNFSTHVHTGGEEFLVLDGVFQDEHGDFPKGSYVRNPPQSSHTPRSDDGCIIFVKLWQFDLGDRMQMHVKTDEMNWQESISDPNRKIKLLYRDDREEVFMESWQPNSKILLDSIKGIELLVISGGFEEGGEEFKLHSWLRLPKGWKGEATVSDQGAELWIKYGHLSEQPKSPEELMAG